MITLYEPAFAKINLTLDITGRDQRGYHLLSSVFSEVSLSDTIETDDSGDSLYLLDVVGTDDTMLSDLQDKENSLRVRRAVQECLDEREADIIRRRYGLDGFTPHTQRQVATLYGISRSYVSRLEKRALEKLEQAIGDVCMEMESAEDKETYKKALNLGLKAFFKEVKYNED